MSIKTEYFITILLFISICYTYSGQQRISHNDGQGWDGRHYYVATKQIQQGQYSITAQQPFANRYANHFIIGKYAKLTNTNILDSALIVNLIGAFLTVLLLTRWLRLFLIKGWTRILIMIMFMLTWHVSVRELFHQPMASDAWGSTAFMAALLLLDSIRNAHFQGTPILSRVILFSIIVSIGTLFRESMAAFAVAIFFICNPISVIKIQKGGSLFSCIILPLRDLYKKKSTLLFFIPFLSILITKFFISFLVIPTSDNSYSYIKTLVKLFYTKTPSEFLTGVFIAFGPLLVIVPFYYKYFRNIFMANQELILLLMASIFAGYFGGGDTERILYFSSFPMVFVAMGVSIEKLYSTANRWWLFVIIGLQTFAARVYWYLPDFPNNFDNIPIPFFGLLGNKFPYLYLYSHYGNIYVHTLLLMEYILLFAITFYILNKNRFKHNISFKKISPPSAQ